MQELIYLYDGSLEGFLCCVFESYAKHERLTACYSDEASAPILFTTRVVETDPEHAARVLRKLSKLSPEGADLVRRGFLSCLPEREMRLYRLIVRLLAEGPGFLRSLSDETVYPIWRAVRSLNGEAHLLRGFVRFSEYGGVLGAEIEPKGQVLPLLRSHFCARYRNEIFFIYDRTHREVLFHTHGQAVIQPLEHFQMAPPDGAETAYRTLWKRFYDTIAIKERENPRCRMTHMPKRYWGTMTEFQPPAYFRAEDSPAGGPVPAVPGGRSAPEIPLRSGRSAPASGL